MTLPCHQKLDMSTDRGRILPLGGAAPTNSGFTASDGKIVDTPNAYHRFSRRTGRSSRNNDSDLTPRYGFMSAVGEPSHRNGRRAIVPPQSQSNSYMNEPEPEQKRGLRMTGHEERIVAERTWAEDHPRKLVRSVPPPVRPSVDAQGRTPFITANGLLGKYGVSPGKGQKNVASAVPDIDTRSHTRRRDIEESGLQPQRYNSPYRPVSVSGREKSPIHPETLPLHPEIDKSGLAKQQRFAPTRRHEPSLQGVFHPPEVKPPPPYKLVPPFHTSG